MFKLGEIGNKNSSSSCTTPVLICMWSVFVSADSDLRCVVRSSLDSCSVMSSS